MRRRADNGGDYLAARCAGGRGNTTYTPEAGCIQILISGVPRKYINAQAKQIVEVPIARFPCLFFKVA